MIHKTFIRTNGTSVARVTFTLPDSIWADQIYLVGDFNGSSVIAKGGGGLLLTWS
ncbi:MAG: hypothetical protein P8186_20120 [Anaerolineae bacterium]